MRGQPTGAIGIIVGSGMADVGMGGRLIASETAYGQPSAPLRATRISGQSVIVLPRHGDRHDLPPHAINYRANLAALRQQGCVAVLSLNTVGVIPESIEPGDLVVPAQVIDYTWGREHTIFDGGDSGVGHVEFGEPFDARLRAGLLAAAASLDIPCHDGGVYGATQGPRLESAAEVDRLERDGVTVIGMTGMPEFSLARELALPLACLSLAVNPAAGRGQGAIHAAIDASTNTAKHRAISVLERFLTNDSV